MSVPSLGEGLQPVPDKIRVHFKPVASAPILRQSKFKVPSAWAFRELQASLRSQLQIPDSTPLYLYCNSAFEPCADQPLSDLFQCFHINKELIMSYSITEAWG